METKVEIKDVDFGNILLSENLEVSRYPEQIFIKVACHLVSISRKDAALLGKILAKDPK